MADPRFDRDDPPMPSWRGRAAIVSAVMHLSPLVVAMIWVAMPATTPTFPSESPRSYQVTRVFVPPLDEPFAIDSPIPPEQLSGYELSGLPFNLAKIAARRESLFPFITADLSFLERMSADLRASQAQLRDPLDRSLVAQPLLIDDRAIQHLIDESWSRRDRWQRFTAIASLLITHDPDEGQAPQLMRQYLDQNLLQPYCAGKTKDGQFWALLENASDHADFLQFIRRYARTHSSTRTTTELLFLMDELAQASEEAATTVVATSVSKDLAYSAVNAPRSALLAANVGNQLRYWFASRQLSANSDMTLAYDRVRLRVLATIVDTTPGGYRASDARFLAGAVLFRQSNLEDALEWWRPMQPAADDTYRDAALAIKRAIGREGRLDQFELRRILWTESARWAEINYNRMRQFGYACDSY
jgi:hypothetical protein